MQPQQQPPTIPAPPPLWRGEYDRIYRLMAAAKLRAAAGRGPTPEATALDGSAP
jgi:hypothetical protein